MEPYQERLIEEEKALVMKIGKLHEFLKSDKMNYLTSRHRDLIRDQYDVMKRYANILGNRLEDLGL